MGARVDARAIVSDVRRLSLSERDGAIWRFDVAGDELRNGERIGALPRLSKRKNNGWEGISIAPAGTFVSRMELVAAHQTKPRRIADLRGLP